MINRDKVLQAIFDAIDEVNCQLPKDEKLKKSNDALLFGDGGSLDSLGLISLVTTIEQLIEEEFGMTATILEDIEALENENPFESVITLLDFLTATLEQKAGG
jgi:acyl carrier protein